MNNTKVLVTLAGCLAFGGALSLLPGQTPGAGIEQQLRSQYPTASVGNNGVVVRAGTVVIVQQDGIMALPAPREWPCNTYKPASRIKQSNLCAVNYNPTKPESRVLQVGEKAYLTAIQVKPSEIMFKVQTCCGGANDAPFRAAISFQFPKGYLDSMKFKEIQDTISQILAPDAGSSVQGSDQPQPNQPQGAGQSTPFESYVDPQRSDVRLRLSPDGSFDVHAEDGKVHSGRYVVNGDTLVLTYGNRASFALDIRGNEIYYRGTLTWVRQGGASAPAPPVEPLRLPSTCVSAQAPADRLQMNGDHTFSLQEAGQSYRGSFAQNGSTLEFTIADTDTKTTATIRGNSLTDSSGQTWVCAEQAAGTAPVGATLKNGDIIKMAKAGFDDAIIIAKIDSSQCQFDTSTDALIQLKQGGVSAAVIKAIMGAGK